MKLSRLSALSAAITLLASGSVADEQIADQLWVAVYHVTDKDYLNSVENELIAYSASSWTKETPAMQLQATDATETFQNSCIFGLTQISFDPFSLLPARLFANPVRGVSEADRKKYLDEVFAFEDAGENPFKQDEVVNLLKNKLYPGYLAANPLQSQVFWTSNAEKMAKPICSTLPQVMGPNYTEVLSKHVTLDQDQWALCVNADNYPVCNPATTPEQKERNDACFVCSITKGSNAMVASVVGAAALVALGLFF